MFFRLFGCNIKRQLRDKELVFWGCCFPLILGTLFAVTFGSFESGFEQVPVAYVTEKEADEAFTEVLEALEEEEELVELVPTSLEEGKRLLQEKEVEGLILNKAGEQELFVKENGISQSILKTVIEQYAKMESTLTRIGSTHPENLTAVIEGMEQEISVLKEIHYTDSPMDSMTGYFYALIAMSCLYGCFAGVNCAVQNKANLTPLAARKSIGSVSRFVHMAADILSAILMQSLYTIIAIFYLKYVQNINFGSKLPQMLLVVVIGAFIGVATGFFIGALNGMKSETKTGLAIAVTMIECFLSGLMVQNMYHIIQDICPVLNKINPAALLVDALYSLDIYADYTRFYQNLGILAVISLLLCAGSFWLIRRERYASI